MSQHGSGLQPGCLPLLIYNQDEQRPSHLSRGIWSLMCNWKSLTLYSVGFTACNGNPTFGGIYNILNLQWDRDAKHTLCLYNIKGALCWSPKPSWNCLYALVEQLPLCWVDSPNYFVAEVMSARKMQSMQPFHWSVNRLIHQHNNKWQSLRPTLLLNNKGQKKRLLWHLRLSRSGSHDWQHQAVGVPD